LSKRIDESIINFLGDVSFDTHLDFATVFWADSDHIAMLCVSDLEEKDGGGAHWCFFEGRRIIWW